MSVFDSVKTGEERGERPNKLVYKGINLEGKAGSSKHGKLATPTMHREKMLAPH